jgi:hypothetical protein
MLSEASASAFPDPSLRPGCHFLRFHLQNFFCVFCAFCGNIELQKQRNPLAGVSCFISKELLEFDARAGGLELGLMRRWRFFSKPSSHRPLFDISLLVANLLGALNYPPQADGAIG